MSTVPIFGCDDTVVLAEGPNPLVENGIVITRSAVLLKRVLALPGFAWYNKSCVSAHVNVRHVRQARHLLQHTVMWCFPKDAGSGSTMRNGAEAPMS